MANISTGILGDANTFNLKELPDAQVRKDARDLLVDGEQIIESFTTVRDQVLFTNKRVLVINVQGLTGKKVSFFSYPYSKVQYFGIETAGVLDIDSELVLMFSNGAKLQFDFKAHVNIKQICASISQYIL